MRIDGKGPDLAAAWRNCHLALGVRQGRGVEELGNALPALNLHEEDSFAVVCEGQCKRRSNRRLPGTPLARYDVEGNARPPRLCHGLSVIGFG